MDTMINVVDANGLNGSLALGMVRAGMRLQGRVGTLALGRDLPLRNRHLFGDFEDAIDPDLLEPDDWTVFGRPADVVVAVPPCSAFSQMSRDKRASPPGPENPINQHMVDSLRYAARHVPKVYIFESVQNAHHHGLVLMRYLHDELEIRTGEQYYVTHWLHDARQHGNAQRRPRYMFVATRHDIGPMTFAPDQRPVLTLRDVIGDLEHRGPEVDGHVEKTDGQMTRQVLQILEMLRHSGQPWAERERTESSVRRLTDEQLNLVYGPVKADRLRRNGYSFSAFQTRREAYDRECSVISGGGRPYHLHPTQDRTLTLREIARIQGWPDELRIGPADYPRASDLEMMWGKSVTVSVSEYIGQQIVRHLEGLERLDARTGEETGARARELVLDETPSVTRSATPARPRAARTEPLPPLSHFDDVPIPEFDRVYYRGERRFSATGPKSEAVLRVYFHDDGKDLSRAEIAEICGCSPGRVAETLEAVGRAGMMPRI